MNLPEIVLPRFKETYMLLMDYPSIGEEDISYYAKETTWNLLSAYKVHSIII